VLVANHQSFFDIFAVAAYIPGEPVSSPKNRCSDSSRRLCDAAFRTRHNRSRSRRPGNPQGNTNHSQRLRHLRFRPKVIAFNDNRIHEFNDGAAWLAILSKLPAVPMSISGSGRFFPRGAKVVIPGGTMRMRIGKPISTERMRSADAPS